MKTYLGQVMRDIIRKVPSPDAELSELLFLAKQLLQQKRDDKNKLYSLHAPEVECIAKGLHILRLHFTRYPYRYLKNLQNFSRKYFIFFFF